MYANSVGKQNLENFKKNILRGKDMINALHLLWIIPASATFGFLIAALLSANKY